jgi:glycosyltransferase involved in cell wall biosynthesis
LSISAIIPTYNRKLQVFRAINSVLAQTLPVNEIIVVDDGSTDGTSEAIRAHYGSRVTVIRQENRGVSVARTCAIEEARSEWLAFLDSDDTWLPAKLERQFEALAALGKEYGVCFTNCNYIGNSAMDTTVFEEAGLKTSLEFGPLNDPVPYIVGKKLLICVCSLLARRSLIKEVGGFDEALGLVEDADLLFRLSFKTRFCYVSMPLVSIDRSKDLPRLTGSLVHMDDQAYASFELFAKKMLATSELVDCEIRQTIQDNLVGLYYRWASAMLRDLRPMAALQNVHKIRRMGHSYSKITSTLFFRAGRKLSRALSHQVTGS